MPWRFNRGDMSLSIAGLAAALIGSSNFTKLHRQGRFTEIVDGMGGFDGDA
jgi:hypothetical protein